MLGYIRISLIYISLRCTGQSENAIDRLAVVETEKSSTGVTVSWFKPITANPVLHYEVIVFEKLEFREGLLLVQNFTTNETKAEIKNLRPATNYSIKIKAVVDGDEDVPETTIDVTTEKSRMYLHMPIHYIHMHNIQIGQNALYKILFVFCI